VPTPPEEWVKMQEALTSGHESILDGDLGLNDALEVRLQAADTIILLDFSLIRCDWRAVLRSRERADFWMWLLKYRHQRRPFLMKAIARHAPYATLHVLRSPQALRSLLAEVARGQRPQPTNC